ncbi:hypothetical protein [Streptomyces sp. NBC_00102]|uniref:hypothetical protein n=1 Tax=Streptomyces sp. NBC_00102 TaxID=2975652 RepID=UPI0022595D13|nr:hypothetical protein [Streptomyces sp. NBC_00102]MCX5398756.1 hypothetical protein [Streptomyces sp. NBC_00102]
MPRGRHRHSPPLHKLLPPSAVAGVSVVLAAGAWLPADSLPVRLLATAAAATGLVGAYLMRSWDQAAGVRVAELQRAQAGAEWRAEERIAELEQDLEEARELRTRLETKLRSKRMELAGLRGEHAGLLRRYATAETERASALEGRRQLAIEAAATPIALPPARSTPTPSAYLAAARALRDLPRNAALQQARRTAEQARQRDLDERARESAAEADGPRGRHAADGEYGDRTGGGHADSGVRADAYRTNGTSGHGTPAHPADFAPRAQRPGAQPALPAPRAAAPSPVPARVARTVPAASAVVPYTAPRRAQVPQGGFDFFGTQPEGAAAAAPEADTGTGAAGRRQSPRPVQEEDLADVVGEEALAVHRSRVGDSRAVGKVIDLAQPDPQNRPGASGLRGAAS